jgi:hypothetical protein
MASAAGYLGSSVFGLLLPLLAMIFGALAIGLGAATGRRGLVIAGAAGIGVLTYAAHSLAGVIGTEWLEVLVAVPLLHRRGTAAQRNPMDRRRHPVRDLGRPSVRGPESVRLPRPHLLSSRGCRVAAASMFLASQACLKSLTMRAWWVAGVAGACTARMRRRAAKSYPNRIVSDTM